MHTCMLTLSCDFQRSFSGIDISGKAKGGFFKECWPWRHGLDWLTETPSLSFYISVVYIGVGHLSELVFLMSRPISPEFVMFPDFWVSNIPRHFSSTRCLLKPIGCIMRGNIFLPDYTQMYKPNEKLWTNKEEVTSYIQNYR